MGATSGNRLELVFHIDTNFIGAEAPACVGLRQLDADGWITLAGTDVLGTELASDGDEERRERLQHEAERYPEVLSPFVIGESRLGISLIGTDQDETLLARVFQALYPHTDRSSDSNTASNKRRDAMHVAAALRMGVNVFVTSDKPMLKRAGVMREEFNGFAIMDPDRALAFALRLKARQEYREGHPLSTE